MWAPKNWPSSRRWRWCRRTTWLSAAPASTYCGKWRRTCWKRSGSTCCSAGLRGPLWSANSSFCCSMCDYCAIPHRWTSGWSRANVSRLLAASWHLNAGLISDASVQFLCRPFLDACAESMLLFVIAISKQDGTKQKSCRALKNFSWRNCCGKISALRFFFFSFFYFVLFCFQMLKGFLGNDLLLSAGYLTLISAICSRFFEIP